MHNAADGADTIFPVNLFSFGVGSAVIGNSHFVDPHAHACDFAGNLRFKAEALFFNSDALNDLTTKRFEAGLHVREVQVGKHV